MVSRLTQSSGAIIVFFLLSLTSLAGQSAEKVNPNQSAIDTLTDKKALLDAQDALVKSEATLEKDKFPGFGENFGKSGALTVDSAERDKFHITAMSAQAFPDAAGKLAAILIEEGKPVVLLTDADRNVVPLYWSEKLRLDRIDANVLSLIGPPPKTATPEGVAELLGIGSLLSEISQFTQLFRTDKNIAYADSLLPDELFLDLVAVEAKSKVLYPSGTLDALLTGSYGSDFARQLQKSFQRRDSLLSITSAGKKEKAAAILAEMDSLASNLSTPDASTKVPLLMNVLRGELVQGSIKAADGRVLSVRVAAKGGASLRTSSVWRSDRLYASGGVIVTYRLTSGGPFPTIIRAGVILSETKFVRLPLD